MRLQCPNCDAEYEVDASAIPQEGRDVQCSNCGHGWFQTHPDYEPDYELDSALYEPPPQYSAVEAAIPKHEVDPAAMQILREEAAREEALRAAEQKAQAEAVAESQARAAAAAAAAVAAQGRADPEPAPQQPTPQPVPDHYAAPDPQPKADDQAFEANLDALRDQELPMPRITARVTRRRIARLRGESEDEFAAPPAAPEPMPAPSYTDPAPTSGDDWRAYAGGDDSMALEQASDADDLRNMLTPTAPAAKSGRRAGVYTAIVGSLVAVAAYVMGPDLAARLPALAPYLATYVDGVNGLRDGVQTAVPAVIDFASGLVQMLRGWIGI